MNPAQKNSVVSITCLVFSLISGYAFWSEHRRAESLLSKLNQMKTSDTPSRAQLADKPLENLQGSGQGLLQNLSGNSLILGSADASSFADGVSHDAVTQLPLVTADAAWAERNANEMLTSLEKIFPIDEDLRTRLYQYYFEINMGTHPSWNPPENSDGQIPEELEVILGPDKWQQYQDWNQRSSERLSDLETEKQVSYLSGILGLDPSQEESLRTALNDPERFNNQEVSLLGRTLGLNPSQEEKVREIWGKLDTEVSEEIDKRYPLDGQNGEEPILSDSPSLSAEQQGTIRKELLARHLQEIVTEEQLAKLRLYHQLIEGE